MPITRAIAAFGLAALLVPIVTMDDSGFAQSPPSFQREDCGFPLPVVYPQDFVRECGRLVVPEVRDARNTRTFRLAVVVYKASTPDGMPPLLLLHGGPGGNGGTRSQWMELALPEIRKRDVVVFDMRGVGQSEPRICPDFEASASKAFLLPTRREWENAFRESVPKCTAELDAQGLNRNAYGSDISAADAIDLRRALKYPVWDVYGVSGGGLVAQELLRRDPEGTRAAALVSTVEFGPNYAGHWVLAYQQLLKTIAVECNAQPACRKLSPDVIGDFNALFDEFSRKPIEVTIPNTSPERRILLNGEFYAMKMRESFGGPAANARIPLMLSDLRRGNRDAAIRRLVGNGVISAWDAESRLIQCNEYGAGYRQAVVETLPQLLPAFRVIADDFREHCDLWVPNLTRQHDQRVIKSNAPVLVTHGQFDPMIQPNTQQAITAGFTRAYSYTFPGESHAGPPVGCHGSIVRQFLVNPFQRPDDSCLARMVPIRYKTQYEPLVTVRITSATPSALAGEWEATLAGPPDWTVELELSDGKVTGSIREQMLPVSDGRADATSIWFRVNSWDDSRTITFTAILKDDTLSFTRDVEVRRGPARVGGPGLLGGTTLRAFIAKRVRIP